MGIDNAPVMDLLKSTMGWLTAREKTLAENVANADTPGYTPRDISQSAFEKVVAQEAHKAGLLAGTSNRHFSASSQSAGAFDISGLKPSDAPDSSTTINGNSVVLEDQMTKVAETRMQYEAVVGLYQKSLAMIRSAARSPGR